MDVFIQTVEIMGDMFCGRIDSTYYRRFAVIYVLEFAEFRYKKSLRSASCIRYRINDNRKSSDTHDIYSGKLLVE